MTVCARLVGQRFKQLGSCQRVRPTATESHPLEISVVIARNARNQWLKSRTHLWVANIVQRVCGSYSSFHWGARIQRQINEFVGESNEPPNPNHRDCAFEQVFDGRS